MNLQQIDYILAVYKLKNFGNAADKCFISQSTLSTMIGKFEKEIGIQIFDRKTKPVSVTKEGVKIIEQLKSISNEISSLKDLIATQKGDLSGNLKIACIPTVAPYIIPKFLNDFTKKYANINFTFSELTTELIIDSLIKRELDIGILAIPLLSEHLMEHSLYYEPFVLYNCTEEKINGCANLTKLNFEKLWLLEESHCLHTQVKSICELDKRKNDEENNLDFKVGSIDSLIRFVKSNKGITLLPYLSVLEFSKSETQKVSNFEKPLPVRNIGLVVHKHFVKQPILKSLKQEIQKNILPLLNIESKIKKKVIAPF